jgi:hypothetical protein
MTRAQARALILVALVIAVAVSVAFAGSRPQPSAGSRRPTLLLLTSLPLLFSEDFSLEGHGAPALKALQAHYRVTPISTTAAGELAKGGLLLIAQPQAQSPENLVTLDQWVRRGGRLLLLADPMLEWPSKLPLGDPTRPPPMFVDTGLLGHWGLTLDAPDERGPALRELGHYRVLTVSPGALYGQCAISRDRLVAECRVGSGEAVVVADADLLDVNRLGRGASHNLDAVLGVLARLEQT